MELYWIWLTACTGLSNQGVLHALREFESPEGAFRATEREVRTSKLTKDQQDALLHRDLTEAKRIETECWEKDIHILTIGDARYPELLRHIPNPPALLYYLGTFPDFDEELTIAIVGHRKASEHGKMMARKLGYELSKSGVILVSGMAAGIDGAAMEGALHGGSPVVGVLGGGVDVIYPRNHRKLYRDILEYGCLISEYPPGTAPIGWHFPIRNRIISGLSRGVVVAEAPRKSGSLITAEHALEQGRDVFAVPGNAGMEICAGSNDLLRQGAIYTEYGADVLNAYRNLFQNKIHVPDAAEQTSYEAELAQLLAQSDSALAASPMTLPQVSDKKVVDNPDKGTYIDVHEIAGNLPQDEATVLSTLCGSAMQVDIIIQETGLPAAKVLGALTMLEIRGLIRSLPGGSYALKEKGN